MGSWRYDYNWNIEVYECKTSQNMNWYLYYDEFRNERQEGQEEELEEVKQQYCKLDPARFLQKPISNVDLVKSIEKIMRLNKGVNIQNK